MDRLTLLIQKYRALGRLRQPSSSLGEGVEIAVVLASAVSGSKTKESALLKTTLK